MCDAFECERFAYSFVNADHYDGAEKHINSTFAYLLCALINLKTKHHEKEEIINGLIQKIEGIICDRLELSAVLLDEILDAMVKNSIVF